MSLRSALIQWTTAMVIGVLALTAQAQTNIGESSGRVQWNGWAFDYDTFTKNDGLTLHNVSYGGIDILGRASFPVMSVYYDQNVCGPYADRLNGPQATVGWSNDAKLVAREFTQDGKQWFELGIREFIGSYDIYQAWYISAEGELDGHVFSRGLQCQVDHIHYPMWRLDFDINGPDGDRIVRETSAGQFSVQNTEFEVNATTAFEHGWFVEDIASGFRVRVDFDDGSWNVAGNVVPQAAYANNRVGGMVSRVSEEAWPGAASESFPHDNNENIASSDVVMWYRGYLPHTPEEGPDLWHSTGVRITATADTDGDGINNAQDPDDDNDGVPDTQDDLPLDATESVDTDNDGIGNNADIDDDNDRVADADDQFPLDSTESIDTDGDGVGDNADLDADNDGIPDSIETGSSAFSNDIDVFTIPANASSSTQLISLAAQNVAIGQTVTLTELFANGDLNGSSETFTLDINDGEFVSGSLQTGVQCQRGAVLPALNATITVVDIGNAVPGIKVTGTSTNAVDDLTNCTGIAYEFVIQGSSADVDTDGDGIVDLLDLDSDNDGLRDVSEAGGTDADNDGIIDNPASNQATLTSPLDSDSDNIANYLDVESTNASNDGTAFDLTGSVYEPLDTNGDGTINGSDATGGTDANGNGIDDIIENTDPNPPDFDGDGIPDATDPDDDNDGISDANDAFPLNAQESLDTDNDGIGNNADTDDDNDGVSDAADAFPLDANESVDTDGDGIGNNTDTDDDNDGLPDVSDPNPLEPDITSGQGCNRLDNGSFESGVTGWTTNTTLTSSSDAFDGNGALSFTDGWIGNVIEATAGTVYSFSGYYKSPVASGWAGFGVDFVDASGNEVGELVRTLDPTTSYAAFSLEGRVPVGATFIRPWVYAQAGRTVLLDEIDLRKDGCLDGQGEVNQLPFVENPGSQISYLGDSVSLAVTATDPESASLTYSALGLPVGLTISPTTGQISGTVSEVTSQTVTVTANDGQGQSSASFVWTVSQPGGNAACNQMPNGGFENGVGSWTSSVAHTLTDDAYSGNAALTFSAGWISLTLPATGATNYTLTGQVKTNDATGWAGYGMDYLNASGAEIGEEVRTIDSTTGYAGFSVAGTSPVGTAAIRVWFYANGNRTITLDDIDLRHPNCSGGGTTNACNQVVNPDFEISDGGWFTNTSPQLVADAAQGNQAVALSGGYLSTSISAQPGTSYTASAMLKASGASGWVGMGIDFVDATGVKLGDSVITIDNSGQYELATVTAQAPPNTSAVNLWFYADDGRTVFVDDVDLRATNCQ